MIENKEIWKNIKDCDNYQVSNFGQVRSLDHITPMYCREGIRHRKGRILKPQKNKFGYLHVTLIDNEGKVFKRNIHRLVAQAFLDDFDDKKDVNHIDENKSNNHLSNLNCMTRHENMCHGTGNSRRAKTQQKYTIEQYTKEGEFVKTWNSFHEIERETGFHLTNISSACRNYPNRRPYGFMWIKKSIN